MFIDVSASYFSLLVYTHSLTSSLSDELLSSVIILTPTAESESMLCVVSTVGNTWTFSSATDSKMERSYQRHIESLMYNEVHMS